MTRTEAIKTETARYLFYCGAAATARDLHCDADTVEAWLRRAHIARLAVDRLRFPYVAPRVAPPAPEMGARVTVRYADGPLTGVVFGRFHRANVLHYLVEITPTFTVCVPASLLTLA